MLFNQRILIQLTKSWIISQKCVRLTSDFLDKWGVNYAMNMMSLHDSPHLPFHILYKIKEQHMFIFLWVMLTTVPYALFKIQI